MTPNQLLEKAKLMFDVLYYDDSKKLSALLFNSLAKYEKKAGAIKVLEFEAGSITAEKPSDFLSIVSCKDSSGRFHEYKISDVVTVIERDTSEYPFTVEYLMNLKDIANDEDLPVGCTSIIFDHLVAQIELKNVPLERDVLLSLSEPADHLQSTQELKDKIKEIEDSMEEEQSILSSFWVTE